MLALQVAIVATGVPQNLPNVPVVNSITITAPSANSANVAVSPSPTETATTGYLLAAGASVTVPLRAGNLNAIWIVGTAGNIVSIIGA